MPVLGQKRSHALVGLCLSDGTTLSQNIPCHSFIILLFLIYLFIVAIGVMGKALSQPQFTRSQELGGFFLRGKAEFYPAAC